MAVLEAVRLTRFQGDWSRCPRCLHRRFHRWGHFSGRQRYRCLGCKRTFSDLTGTPMAYSKRLDRWLGYVGCLLGSLSVRESGRLVGIHKDTALRWRHRFLDAHRRREDHSLSGLVELAEIRIPRSRKGQRPPGSPTDGGMLFEGRKRRLRDRILLLHVRDRNITLEAFLGSAPKFGPPSVHLLEQTLLPRMTPSCTMITERDSRGRYRAFCDRAGLELTLVTEEGRRRNRGVEDPRRSGTGRVGANRPCGDRPLPGPPPEVWAPEVRRRTKDLGYVGSPRPLDCPPAVHRAHEYGFRFRRWLARFRGVATRYLPNYFSWHRFLEGAVPELWAPAPERLGVLCRRLLASAVRG